DWVFFTHRETTVLCLQADVADRESLNSALRRIPDDWPPVRGIFHAAGVLADGMLYEMSPEQFDRAMAPKVAGAWNLHQLSADMPLDHFVMFSSVASVLGSPGQANYAAGNAFLDGLAALRRSRGLPACAINWGPWADAGMATRQHRERGLRERGMRMLDPEEGIRVMEQLLRESSRAQTTVMDVDWTALAGEFGGRRPPLLEDFADHFAAAERGQTSARTDGAMLKKLQACPPDQRRARLEEFMASEVGRIMGIEPEQLPLEQSLAAVGVDSLMAWN
ncbi:MAG: beta-ketoacyl reductase, partial [Planctomycetota bacterium]